MVPLMKPWIALIFSSIVWISLIDKVFSKKMNDFTGDLSSSEYFFFNSFGLKF